MISGELKTPLHLQTLLLRAQNSKTWDNTILPLHKFLHKIVSKTKLPNSIHLKLIPDGYVGMTVVNTDGSKTKDGVGCDSSLKLKTTVLNKNRISSFAKELSELITCNQSSAVIWSDSRSALDSIRGTHPKGMMCPILCSVKDVLFRLNIPIR